MIGARHVNAGEVGKILVVDDDPDLREVMEIALESHGHKVATAVSGMAALRTAREEPFDVAITDHRMEGISGIDFVDELRRIDPTLPVIVVSGIMNDALASDYAAHGAYSCVHKPFELPKLLALLQRAIASRR